MNTIHRGTMAVAFLDGEQLLIHSQLSEVALKVKALYTEDPHRQILVFDALASHVIDLDLRGSDAEIIARLAPEVKAEGQESKEAAADVSAEENPSRGRGRPKLGVVPREVTLLPQHWDWLNQQTGGASVALRKLVEDARRRSESQQQARFAMDSAYRFMAGLAGNQPNYEEATRALFAGDGERFVQHIQAWPADVRHHVTRLAQAAFVSAKETNS